MSYACDHYDGHDAWKSDEVWETLPSRGYQDMGEPDEVLELRDAPCGSTLARPRRVTAEQRLALLGGVDE